MKSIKASDSAHEKLLEHANMNYRTLTGELDWVVDTFFGEPKAELAIPSNESASTSDAVSAFYNIKNQVYDMKRRMSWLLAEIQSADKELADAMNYDQDPDSQIERKKAHKVYTQPLWNEFNSIKDELAEMTKDVVLDSISED